MIDQDSIRELREALVECAENDIAMPLIRGASPIEMLTSIQILQRLCDALDGIPLCSIDESKEAIKLFEQAYAAIGFVLFAHLVHENMLKRAHRAQPHRASMHFIYTNDAIRRLKALDKSVQPGAWGGDIEGIES